MAENPTAATAFSVLAGLSPGDDVTWVRPEVDPPEVPTGDIVKRALPHSYEVRHAMDAEISVRLAEILQQRATDKEAFAAPSLKHISRNPPTLFHVVDVLLAHGA